MTKLHPSIQHLAMPKRMRHLGLTDAGYPALWFAEIVNGKPELRVMSPTKMIRAIKERRCWLCGDRLGKHLAFVIGPMCTITRTTQEPPSHLECAHYAVQACPFLTRPNRERRETDLLEKGAAMMGIGISRNPGVSAIWVTSSYRTWSPRRGQLLITIGDPLTVEWWAEGRLASRQEVADSINSGAPVLWEMCEKDRDPVGAKKQLAVQIAQAEAYLPAGMD